LRSVKEYSFKKFCGLLYRLEEKLRGTRLELEDKHLWCSKEERSVIRRNIALRDFHRGAPAFVIGNGPSLGKQDLGRLKGQVTFAMSGFWKHPVLNLWQPTYYCFADPMFFDGSNAMESFFTGLSSSVKDTRMLLPLSAHRSCVGKKLEAQYAVYYMAFQGALHRCSTTKVDFCKQIPGVTSVAQFAMLSALYMGCSPIYLLGLDHDWLAQRGNDRHFYAGKTVEGHARAHGDLGRIPYKTDLESVLQLWNGYERLGIIASRNGSKIINLTDGGFLDVFPRENLDDVLKRMKSDR